MVGVFIKSKNNRITVFSSFCELKMCLPCFGHFTEDKQNKDTYLIN